MPATTILPEKSFCGSILFLNDGVNFTKGKTTLCCWFVAVETPTIASKFSGKDLDDKWGFNNDEGSHLGSFDIVDGGCSGGGGDKLNDFCLGRGMNSVVLPTALVLLDGGFRGKNRLRWFVFEGEYVSFVVEKCSTGDCCRIISLVFSIGSTVSTCLSSSGEKLHILGRWYGLLDIG